MSSSTQIDATINLADCGFGTFADRPVNTTEIAQQKLHRIAEAAEALRQSRP